ncbi:MAG: hypothetical protein ACI3ZE_03090 [Candidatus Woodwardiibium sp.]
MDTSLLLGSIVTSLCGRDKGRSFVVVEIIDADYVYIADGRLRRVESPKRKKIKHISVLARTDEAGGARMDVENVTNKSLREFLSALDG